MSEVLFLKSGNHLASGDYKFPDLKNRLESDLIRIQTLPDLEALIRSVNDLVKEKNYGSDEVSYLKRIRQRAYDRRRNFKPSPEMQKPLFSTFIKEEIPMLQPVYETAVPAEKVGAQPVPQSVKRAPERVAQTSAHWFSSAKWLDVLPGFVVLVVSTVLTCFLVWLQSIELYLSSGFSHPGLTAAGAILMVGGFAAYHSVSRSWLALLLCLYVGGYEAFFMVSGTVQDEHVSVRTHIDSDPELDLLREKAERSKVAYTALKERLNNSSSDVHGNEWFQRKYVDPAWVIHSKDQEAFVAKRQALESKSSANHVTWLKILYRLGLVFLCMVLVHRLVGMCRKILVPNSEIAHTA